MWSAQFKPSKKLQQPKPTEIELPQVAAQPWTTSLLAIINDYKKDVALYQNDENLETIELLIEVCAKHRQKLLNPEKSIDSTHPANFISSIYCANTNNIQSLYVISPNESLTTNCQIKDHTSRLKEESQRKEKIHLSSYLQNLKNAEKDIINPLIAIIDNKKQALVKIADAKTSIDKLDRIKLKIEVARENLLKENETLLNQSSAKSKQDVTEPERIFSSRFRGYK